MAEEIKPALLQTARAKYTSNSANVIAHRRMIDSEPFQKGTEVALLEYTKALVVIASSNKLTEENAQFAQAALWNRVVAAHEFLEVLNRVGDPYPKTNGKPPENVVGLTEPK